MWTRSSHAYSGKLQTHRSNGRVVNGLRRVLLAGTCLFLIGTCGTALAQNSPIKGRERLDPVTERVMKDPLIQLRFQALSLETLDEVGQALEGLVRAMLARDRVADAKDELKRIEDDLWRARAMRSIALYQTDHNATEDAKALLSQAQKTIKVKKRPKRAGELLRIIAIEQADIGALEDAIVTASRIPSVLTRLSALQRAAAKFQNRAGGSNKAKRAASRVLSEAFQQAAKLQGRSDELVDIFVDIARTQATARDNKGAVKTLRFIRKRLDSGQPDGPHMRYNRAYARIASAFTFAGDHPDAMDVLRNIPEGSERAVALSAVARSLGQTDNTDAALALFTLAKEQLINQQDGARKNKVLSLIVRDEAIVDRYADAFTTAGSIPDKEAQSRALLGMAAILLQQDKDKEARILLNYIPYISMRVPIYADLATRVTLENAEDRLKVSNLLIESLKPTGFDPIISMLPGAIRSVLAVQLTRGSKEMDEQIFTQIRELIRLLPDNLIRVNALTFLATAQAARSMKNPANKTIGNAWTLAWLNKKDEGYPLALANIAQSQIAVGDVLSAFDTAARLPQPTPEQAEERAPDGSFRAPKFDALTTVAVAAAKAGELEMALRAAKQIEYPSARAAAMAAVAVAVASPDKSVREVVGIGPTDIVEYNVLDFTPLHQEVVSEEEILETNGLTDVIELDGQDKKEADLNGSPESATN